MDIEPAGEYASTLSGFKRLRTRNPQRFQHLDWTNVQPAIIDDLFPIVAGRYGSNPHPPSYLASTALVEQWRKLSKSDQLYKIKQHQDEEKKRAVNEKKAAGRASRARRGRRSGDDLQRTPPKQVTTKKRARRGQGTPDSAFQFQDEDNNGSDGMDSAIGRQLSYNNPPPVERHDTTTEIAAVEMYSTECRGISRAIINASRIQDKTKVVSGYAHIAGNVHRWLGSYLSNNNAEWPYGPDVAGFLVNPNADADEQYTWVCMRVVEAIHDEGDDEDVVRDMVRFSFAHKLCTGETESGKQLCKECKKNQYNFFTMCRNEVDKREEAKKNPMLAGRNDYRKFNTPTIMLPYINELTQQIKILRTKLWKAEKAIDALYEQAKDMDATNVDHELLFDEQILRDAYAKFQQEVEVTERQMMDLLFQECLKVKQRMRQKGNAKGHIYTPLMIRFAIMLRNKLSQSNYDFIRQVFGLPTNATLCEYRNADTTAEDGLMHETCMQQAQWMKEMGIPLRDFRRYVGLSFDSHTIRCKLAYCPHTKRIVGYAQDAFDQDVIIKEFKRMGEEVEEEEEENDVAEEEGKQEDADDDDEDDIYNKKKKEKKDDKLAQGKHYYVFVVQSLTSKGPPIRFIAARYCVANLSHRWLRAKLEYIEAALAFYGVIVCSESFDGASENRSCMKHRTTLTFEDICGKELKIIAPVELAAQLDDLDITAVESAPAALTTTPSADNANPPAMEHDCEESSSSSISSSEEGELSEDDILYLLGLNMEDIIPERPQPTRIFSRHWAPGAVVNPYVPEDSDRRYSIPNPNLPTAIDLNAAAAADDDDDDDVIEIDCSDMEEDAASSSHDSEERKRYAQHELPWEMTIAFHHPSMKGVIVVATGDMGHGAKKERNAMDLSGKEDKVRDLHHNGLPVNLKMALDVWKLTPDADPKCTSALMLYPKLSLSVFCPTSKTAMRTSDAARAQGNSMMEMLLDYGHLNKKAGPRAYDSLILHCANTDLWVNVMNGTPTKGCETIKCADHRHIYDLCDYVAYLTEWKLQVTDKNEFFPDSTYEDICYTSLGTVALAQFYLPKFTGHDLIQSRLGSDPCESTFMSKRNANPNADKIGTDHILASVHGGPLMQLWASRKGNVEKKRVFFGNELMLGKFKRTRQVNHDETE